MSFREPPAWAAWQHHEARTGFEVAFFQRLDSGYRVEGSTSAVEDGVAWVVAYSIDVDDTWTTRTARVTATSATGHRRRVLAAHGSGHWRVDADLRPDLDGCLDVDLESSAMTNAFPVHRLGLRPEVRADAPAAYVRVPDLAVDRLEQEYRRTAEDGAHQRYDYATATFDFRARLVYDESGLVLDYPGIALRVG